ncbi:YIP1 family protein [Pelagibacteraceae bacterium]|nr:YIP1 family protein [Pelagibacteraceae bacterium]
MISLFLNRIFRSIKIDPEVFNEVQKDKNATLSAAIVVILSSSAAGIGASQLGTANFILAPILSIVSWFVWAYIVYFVGVKLFPDSKTKTTQVALLRAIGFSSAPGMIRIFGYREDLMTVIFIGSALWMLACMVVAVKETLNYKSLLKALGVVIISWFVQAFLLLAILFSTRSF